MRVRIVRVRCLAMQYYKLRANAVRPYTLIYILRKQLHRPEIFARQHWEYTAALDRC